MYKGTVKKWQILDDSVFDKEQVELLQLDRERRRTFFIDRYEQPKQLRE